MELFAIHCTTCKARLIVKDESAIGDILSCPKCHSMVQVVPPPGWVMPAVAAPAADVAVAPIAKPTSAPAQTRPAVAKAGASAKTAPSKTAGSQVAAAALLTPHATPPPLAAATAPATDVASAAAPPALPQRVSPPAEAPAEMPVEAASGEPALATAAMGSNWTLLGAGIGSGVLLGALAWLTIWLMSPADAPSVASVTPAPVSVSPPQPDTHAPGTQQTAADDAPQLPDTTATTPEPAPTIAPPAEVKVADAATEVPPAAVSPPTVAPPAAQPPVIAAPKPELKLDPVAPQPAAPTDAALPHDSHSEVLPEDTAKSTDSEHPVADAQPATVESSLGEPRLLPVSEIERRLGVAIARVDFSGVSIGHLAGFLSDVSGARVVVDEPSLAKSGKSRKTPITVKLTGGTALAILQAATDQAGLDYKIEPGRITLTARGP